jgi:hypothetical protein
MGRPQNGKQAWQRPCGGVWADGPPSPPPPVHIDVALELSKVNTAGGMRRRTAGRLAGLAHPPLSFHTDKLHYSTITVDSFEDAVIAVIYNHDIQAVVFTSDFDLHSDPMGCKYRMLMTIDGFEKLQGTSYSSLPRCSRTPPLHLPPPLPPLQA